MGEIRFRDKKTGQVRFIAEKDGKIFETNKKGIKDKLVSEPENKESKDVK